MSGKPVQRKTVAVSVDDLAKLVAHCRETWPPSGLGRDALTRCEYALSVVARSGPSNDNVTPLRRR